MKYVEKYIGYDKIVNKIIFLYKVGGICFL